MALTRKQQAALDACATKQRAFVLEWLANGGNGTEAARAAGHKGNDATLAVTASKLLRHPKVSTAIAAMREPEDNRKIAGAHELHELWTRYARGEETEERLNGERGVVEVAVSAKDRLKASEMLGRSHGMFLDRVQHEGDVLAALRDLITEKRKLRKGGEDE